MKYFNKCFVDHFKNNCDNRYLRCVGTEIPMDTFCFYFPFSLHVVYRCVAKGNIFTKFTIFKSFKNKPKP